MLKKYKEIDAKRITDAAAAEEKRRRKLRLDWADYEAQKMKEWEESIAKRNELLRGKSHDDDIEEHTQIIEEFVETLREYPV